MRWAGNVLRRFASRAVVAARALTPRQVFAAVFVVAILLYLLVLVVQPTGAGRGGR
jgi:hypothetical protein